MFKKFFKKIIFISVFSLFASNISAQELMMPSLLDTMKKNEAQLKESIENARKTESGATLSPQFTPALADNFSYETIYSGSAITIKKALGTELYVQDINIASGASVASSLEVVSYNEKTGEPQYQKKNVSDAMKMFLQTPTSMINGQFFSTTAQPSELSFSLKSDGIIRTAGADDRGESKNILHIGENFAEILPYSWKNLESATGSFAMGNLTTKVPKYKNENIGRTYMCVPDADAKNRGSRVLVFVAKSLSEWLLENEIYKHGCSIKTTSKLDSSGSSRFTFAGKTMYGDNHKWAPDYRIIPHYIAFFDAKK